MSIFGFTKEALKTLHFSDLCDDNALNFEKNCEKWVTIKFNIFAENVQHIFSLTIISNV